MSCFIKKVFLPLGLLLSAGLVVLFVVFDGRVGGGEKVRGVTSDFALGQHPVFSLSSSLPVSDIEALGSVVNLKGEKVDVPFTVSADPGSPGKVRVEVSPSSNFFPGKYRFVINDPNLKISQDFSWGVLAVNTDRAVYLPGQEVSIALAVLDEKGGMVCDGILSLDIVSPSGRTTTLSVENGMIVRNPECFVKDFVDQPDYQASYTPKGEGTYRMYLSAETPNGVYNISDSFQVQSDVPFDVRRTAPTRIFPLKVYPVKIDITAQTDFTGTVTESLHTDLIIAPLEGTPEYTISPGDTNETNKTNNEGESIKAGAETEGQAQTLSWKVSIKKGQTVTLGYTFDAPDISPYFYLIGPLDFKDNTNKEVFSEPRQWQIAVDATTGPNDPTAAAGDTTVGTVGWTTYTNVYNSNDGWASVSMGKGVISYYIKATGYGFSLPGCLSITGITVGVEKHADIATYTADNSVRLVNGAGTIVGTDKASASNWPATTDAYSTYGGSADNWTAGLTCADVQDPDFGVVFSAKNTKTGSGVTRQFFVDHIQVTVDYTALTMTQRGFILENDDGATVNANSNLAGANATASSVMRGQRLTARMKLENTGGTTQNYMYQLQYSSDGSTWHNVATGSGAPSGNSANTNPNYSLSTVENMINGAEYTSIAIGTDGYPVISYQDSSAFSLKVAKCNDPACSGGDETITTVDDPTDYVGYDTSLSIGTDGYPVIAYRARNSGSTNFYLKVAKCNDPACSGGDETITTVDDPTDYVGNYNSLAIGTDGYPVISYEGHTSDLNDFYLKVAKCNDPACSGNDETFTIVDNPTVNGSISSPSLAIGTDGYPVISYNESNYFTLKVIKCNDAACANNDETITTVDSPTDDVGFYTSLGIGTDGYPVIAYQARNTGGTNYYLKVAKCNDVACSGSDETITTVDDPTDYVGYDTSLGIGTDGYPVIAYQARNTGGTNYYLKVAKCNDAACTNGGEIMTTVDDPDNAVGYYPSLVIGTDGYPVISYQEQFTDYYLKVAKYSPVTEINATLGLKGANGDALTAQKAGTCSVGSSQNGVWYEGHGTTGFVSLATNYCTEVAFVLDTTRAIPNANYQLRMAAIVAGSSSPLVSYYRYPSFSVIEDRADIHRYSKASIPITSSTCTSSSYLCTTLENITDWVGYNTSLGIGTDGYPVISYQDSTAGSLKVAKCNDPACSGGKTITTVEDITNSVGSYSRLAIGIDGYPVIAYQEQIAGSLKVAKCNDPACSGGDETITTVDTTTNTVGNFISLAIGADGYPVISHQEASPNYSLRVVKCNDPACSGGDETITEVENITDWVGYYTSLAIGTDGYPVISYQDGTAGSLKVAKCNDPACSGGETITTVNDPNSVGANTSLAIGTDGYPVISYQEGNPAYSLKVAKCNDPACSGGDETITTVEDIANSVGNDISLAIGTDGYPVISYQEGTAGSLKVAKCVDTACSTAITPTTVEDITNTVGNDISLAIGTDGYPVISHQEGSTAYSLKVAKEIGLPRIAVGYFDNSIWGSKQLKYKNTSESAWPQYIFDSPMIKDGLQYPFDSIDYNAVVKNDSVSASMATGASTESPVFEFIEKHLNNTDTPQGIWKGQSTVACSTAGIYLQVYRFGTTNNWETVASNTACAANTDIVLTSAITSSFSDYYFTRVDFDQYNRTSSTSYSHWIYWRVYQAAGTETLKTNYFSDQNIQTNFTGVNLEGINVN